MKISDILDRMGLVFLMMSYYSWEYPVFNGKRVSPKVDKLVGVLEKLIAEYEKLREEEKRKLGEII